MSLSLAQVAEKLGRVGAVTCNEFLVRAALEEGVESIVFPDGRALVKGTTRPGAARTLYARYLGM